jgi:hypothetical protein
MVVLGKPPCFLSSGFDALALPTGDVGKGVNAPDHSAQRPEYCITLAILKEHTL